MLFDAPSELVSLGLICEVEPGPAVVSLERVEEVAGATVLEVLVELLFPEPRVGRVELQEVGAARVVAHEADDAGVVSDPGGVGGRTGAIELHDGGGQRLTPLAQQPEQTLVLLGRQQLGGHVLRGPTRLHAGRGGRRPHRHRHRRNGGRACHTNRAVMTRIQTETTHI